jgi:hypothetical protein
MGQDWGIGYFNEPGGYTIGRVFPKGPDVHPEREQRRVTAMRHVQMDKPVRRRTHEACIDTDDLRHSAGPAHSEEV